MLRSYRSIITLRLKQSFSMIELASYVAVMGALVVVATGGLSVIKNARVHKVVSELYFYENALSDFVIKYGELPGNMSMERCLMFNEFKDFCRTPQISSGDIMDALTTLNSNKQAFVAMNNNIMGQIMALNYGRFLKTSGIIDSVSTGIDKELETTNLRDGRIKKYLPKLALSFLVNLNMNFIEWLKNKLPYVFFKLGEINENSYFTDFEINIKKMKNKYKVIKMNENDNTTINKEIYDIYKKTIHNMDVFYERNKKDNSIKYNNENCGKAKTYTREKIRIDKRIIFIEISVIILLKILFELF